MTAHVEREYKPPHGDSPPFSRSIFWSTVSRLESTWLAVDPSKPTLYQVWNYSAKDANFGVSPHHVNGLLLAAERDTRAQ